MDTKQLTTPAKVEHLATAYGYDKVVTYYQTRFQHGTDYIIIDHKTRKITFFGNYSRLVKQELQKRLN